MNLKSLKEEREKELQKAQNTYEMLMQKANAVQKRIIELNAEINLLDTLESESDEQWQD